MTRPLSKTPAGNEDFWDALDRLAAESRIVLDRPKGTQHPRYPQAVHPLDYGYLEGTTASDGGGIDIWLGSLPDRALTAVLLTIDLNKRDAELKLILGCTDEETRAALDFLNRGGMRATLVLRPKEIP